jgi:hypothetical protein
MINALNLDLFLTKISKHKTTQKNIFRVVWVVFTVLHLCSDSYALLLYIKI